MPDSPLISSSLFYHSCRAFFSVILMTTIRLFLADDVLQHSSSSSRHLYKPSIRLSGLDKLVVMWIRMGRMERRLCYVYPMNVTIFVG
uniref:Uncharacterized protein n=1 Tax=Caenorhabditis japonica TaxID=281687 RepID=A0A8R1IIP3_CAEJA